MTLNIYRSFNLQEHCIYRYMDFTEVRLNVIVCMIQGTLQAITYFELIKALDFYFIILNKLV